MVSLLISEFGKLVSGHPPETIFSLLEARRYLSEDGLAQRHSVVAALQQILDEWPELPLPGDELWRRMQHALISGAHLNPAGLEATRRYVSRTNSADLQPERRDPPSFASEIGSSLQTEVRSWLRWAAWGAGLGAIALGAAGFWFFGGTGLAYGAAVGAVVGGLAAWLFYVNATSLSS